ncbi:hypothetical protein RNJ44_04298 [Nakaseomyces bracarensis]|uniref:LYC1 C-terminal domain-containing protein n=1 Tax=Nakaseomyces bracarensis TaxID=273131 RepID=A0ABR4NUS0_9SACH
MTVDTHPEHLVFEEIQDPELIRYTFRVNSDAWKGVLTDEQYVEREEMLGKSEICAKYKSGSKFAKSFPESYQHLGIKYFVLKDKTLTNTDKFSQIISRCETLNRLGSCITPSSNGEIEPSLTICIGGVFTPVENRGKGYARIMIEKLNAYYDDIYDRADTIKDAKSKQLVKNMVITLYSEVGEYYSKMGYISKHVPIHDIPGLDTLYEQYCSVGDASAFTGEHFRYDDYQKYVDLQAAQFKKSLLALGKENSDGFTFTVDTDIDIYKWFADRDEFIYQKMGINDNKDTNPQDLLYGFAILEGEYKGSHVIWHHNWNGNELIILKFYIPEEVVGDADTIARVLFGEAIKEAKKFDLRKLEFWDEEIPSTRYPELFRVLENMSKNESKIFLDNGSLSAVRPPHGIHPEKVAWDNNTKFCWF